MLFSWANKQLERLSETMAPITNSATGRFIHALQNNDTHTAQALLSITNTNSNYNSSSSSNNNTCDNSSINYSNDYSNYHNNGSSYSPANDPNPEYVNPHHTIFYPHNQKQSKAIHMTCLYSNKQLFNYILQTFYSDNNNADTNTQQVLSQTDAQGNTLLHYACSSTVPNPTALSFVQFIVDLYKSYNLHSIIIQTNDQGQTPHDVSNNDVVRQYLLPIQLQMETQQCLDNGGIGLMKGIDLGGLKIKNQQVIAPPPIFMGNTSNSSGVNSPTAATVGIPRGGVTSRYAIPTEYTTTDTNNTSNNNTNNYNTINSTSTSTTAMTTVTNNNFHYNHNNNKNNNNIHHHNNTYVVSPQQSTVSSSNPYPININTTTSTTKTHYFTPSSTKPVTETTPLATSTTTSPMTTNTTTSNTPSNNTSTNIESQHNGSNNTESLLPEGWFELVDQSTNTPYYYNQTMNITQWERPNAAAAAADNIAVNNTTLTTTTDSIHTSSPMISMDSTRIEKDVIVVTSIETTKDDDNNNSSNSISNSNLEGDIMKKEETTKEKLEIISKQEDDKDENKGDSSKKETGNDDNADNNELSNDDAQQAISTVVIDNSKQDDIVSDEVCVVDKKSDGKENGIDDSNDAVETKVLVAVNGDNDENENVLASINQVSNTTINKSDDEPDSDKNAPQESQHLSKINDTDDNNNNVSSPSQYSQQELPMGWIELYDESSGRYYYYNHSTNMTQWERPGPTEQNTNNSDEMVNNSTTLQSLPSGWVELIDPTSGSPYYYNHSTNITQWERPIDTFSTNAAASTAVTTTNNHSVCATSKIDNKHQMKSFLPATTTATNGTKNSNVPSNNCTTYAKRGFSSAAVLPTNSKYKPDGFHSSSSDKSLQQKYGHDKSITGPPSGKSFSSTSIGAPPSSGGGYGVGATSSSTNPYASGSLMTRNRYSNHSMSAPSSGFTASLQSNNFNNTYSMTTATEQTYMNNNNISNDQTHLTLNSYHYQQQQQEVTTYPSQTSTSTMYPSQHQYYQQQPVHVENQQSSLNAKVTEETSSNTLNPGNVQLPTITNNDFQQPSLSATQLFDTSLAADEKPPAEAIIFPGTNSKSESNVAVSEETAIAVPSPIVNHDIAGNKSEGQHASTPKIGTTSKEMTSATFPTSANSQNNNAASFFSHGALIGTAKTSSIFDNKADEQVTQTNEKETIITSVKGISATPQNDANSFFNQTNDVDDDSLVPPPMTNETSSVQEAMEDTSLAPPPKLIVEDGEDSLIDNDVDDDLLPPPPMIDISLNND